MKKVLMAITIMAALVACNKKGNNDPETPQEETITVSTDAQNRKVLIEEFTGINCGYCPDGHRIVNELMAEDPENVFGVNIHAGSYASKYKTTEGTAYLGEADVAGFPAGSVNRHLFSTYAQDGGIAMSRGSFSKAASKIKAMSSPVNIGATATINTATSELTVKVKGYFTSDPIDSVTTNSLYVMLLQDSVMGSQSGGSTYNPDQMIDGKYCHMHMLRATINGTWGEEISPIAKGSWFEKSYNYTIPATIGTDNVPTVLSHMKVVVFVAAGHKEIYTVCEPKMVLK